ncbi:MAG: hypothetical protein QM760_04640 [Nibricoccus sp.]
MAIGKAKTIAKYQVSDDTGRTLRVTVTTESRPGLKFLAEPAIVTRAVHRLETGNYLNPLADGSLVEIATGFRFRRVEPSTV